MTENIKNVLTLEERKTIGYDILCYVDKWCREHNVKYYLGYGTLLGAVRHKAFIPWDDDIDIIMFREDYTEFIKQFNTACDGRYKCIDFENGTYYFPYAKVVDTRTVYSPESIIPLDDLGIGIGIFPFDYLENEKVDRLLYGYAKMLRYSLYNNKSELSLSGKNFLKLPIYLFAKCIGWKRWSRIIRKRSEKHFKEQRYCFTAGGMAVNELLIFEKSMFEETVSVTFEGTEFPAPKDFDAVLSKTYGDYMQLPPVESRVAHLGKAFYR